MYIRQELLADLKSRDMPQKVFVLYGPRRVGKSTLLAHFLKDIPAESYLLVDGEDIDVQRQLSTQSIEQLKTFVGNRRLLVIDEAQQIPNIGVNLKLLIDHVKPLTILATGSSSFDLASEVGEPLVGRSINFHLYPLSQIELGHIENRAQTAARLEERILYGAYPEVVLQASLQEKQIYLQQLVSSYLYRDILTLDRIKKSKKIIQLLQLLALQVGKEVSPSELGQQLGFDQKTVLRYLDLLEKAFVLISIAGFSRNPRKEISKRSRYYFYDNGIRNALIRNFNGLSLRNDVGALWENYIVIERIKKQAYQNIFSNNYFWRTYAKQEIDWVEERDGQLYGYELKWKKPDRIKVPTGWVSSYPDAHYEVIHSENYLDFIE